MKFQCTALFWVLLNATASSFATPSNYQSKSMTPLTSKVSLPFVYRGGSDSRSKLSAVQSPSQSMISTENLELLSERGRAAVMRLIENDIDASQRHVYGGWPEPGTQDEDKKRLSEQVRREFSLWQICIAA